jgi:RHS repeat-associated protein
MPQRFGFDPWGARECLNALGSTTSCSSNTTGGATGNGSEERGFTGHEMLDEIGLIHMNGRLYDPEIGRFLQADPIIQEPLNGQNYKHYGYVQINPLSYTDPTGFSWWTKWRRPIVGLVAARSGRTTRRSGE